jgi:ketosteroid isomerase-like protein
LAQFVCTAAFAPEGKASALMWPAARSSSRDTATINTPRKNVELVRQAYLAWNRGDLDSAFAFLDSAVAVSVPPDFPEAGTYRGRAEIRRFVESELLQGLEDARAEPERFIEAGDQVVVFVRYFGRGKESGLEVKGAVVDGHVWTVRADKAVKLEMYQGTENALKAAGLPSSLDLTRD